jgi:hypothetical protein
VDGESDGQPSSHADSDDRSGDCLPAGDEDGVYIWDKEWGIYRRLREVSPRHFQANEDYTLGVVASTNGHLNVWMDFNGNGDWSDPGEQVFDGTPLVPGTNELAFRIPAMASNGYSYARFRFGSQAGLSYTGLAENGEVEDYLIMLVRWTDFGDAPSPYPTREVDNGARHLAGPVYFLGSCVDGEPDGQPSLGADSDNGSGGCHGLLGDEDGVFIWDEGLGSYRPIQEPRRLQANGDYMLGVVASTNGYLNAWVDFNIDGNWSDPGEQVFADTPLVRGTNDLALHIPAMASNGYSFTRFRFSSQVGLSYTGWVENGEVEDHRVELTEVTRINSLKLGDGNVALSWNDTHLSYTVEQSTNQVSGTWVPCTGTWPIGSNGWTGSLVEDTGMVFYRIRISP